MILMNIVLGNWGCLLKESLAVILKYLQMKLLEVLIFSKVIRTEGQKVDENINETRLAMCYNC